MEGYQIRERSVFLVQECECQKAKGVLIDAIVHKIIGVTPRNSSLKMMCVSANVAVFRDSMLDLGVSCSESRSFDGQASARSKACPPLGLLAQSKCHGERVVGSADNGDPIGQRFDVIRSLFGVHMAA